MSMSQLDYIRMNFETLLQITMRGVALVQATKTSSAARRVCLCKLASDSFGTRNVDVKVFSGGIIR